MFNWSIRTSHWSGSWVFAAPQTGGLVSLVSWVSLWASDEEAGGGHSNSQVELPGEFCRKHLEPNQRPGDAVSEHGVEPLR